jgi:hypothetical protein
MAKSREKIQQIGLWDPEVSNPDHDSVCLWAYENADSIFRTVCSDRFDQPWLKNEIHFDEANKGQSANELAKTFMKDNSRPNPRVSRKTLEYVLKSYTGYRNDIERIVGYADLLITTELPRVVPKYKVTTTRGSHDIFDGFQLAWSSDDAPCILVEAKSVLPTVGELMRQIQLYRTAFRGKIVVVSPDDKHSQILIEQGVGFIKYSR